MSAKLLVIGLDAFDPALAQQWAALGKLPHLAGLLRDGLSGPVVNPPGVEAGAVWPSFATAVSPAHHRRFFRQQARRGSYVETPFAPEEIQGQPFWNALSSAGCRVAILDAPHTVPVPELNGVQVVDWATHEPELGAPLSSPASLIGELVRTCGAPEQDHCDGLDLSSAGIAAFVDALFARLQSKLEVSLQLLAQDDWDLFLTVFSEGHCVGHQCWHIHDPTHPRHDPALRQQLGDPLLLVYQRLDEAMGRLLATIGDATVIVLQSHGMGPFYGEFLVLDDILRKLEESSSRGAVYGALRRAWYALPLDIRGASAVRGLYSRVLPSLHSSMLLPDRAARKAFALVNNPHAGAIRVNLAGREPHGLVRPGAEYRAACERLREAMLALVNPETGRPVVRDVVLTAELYNGPYADELPDVLVEWSRQEPLRAISAPQLGTFVLPTRRGRTGDHLPAGFFVARGPGLASRMLPVPVSIMDFGPTLCALRGVSLGGVEGKPIAELLAARVGHQGTDGLPARTD